MTPDELRQCLNVIGLTTREFAAVLKRDDRRIRRWLAGAITIPDEVAAWVLGYARHVQHHVDHYPFDNPPPPNRQAEISSGGSAIT